MDIRSPLRRQPLRVGIEPFRIDPVLNRRKDEARVCSLGNSDRCYKLGGVGHHSKVYPTCKELALFIEDNIDELYRDQQVDDERLV